MAGREEAVEPLVRGLHWGRFDRGGSHGILLPLAQDLFDSRKADSHTSIRAGETAASDSFAKI